MKKNIILAALMATAAALASYWIYSHSPAPAPPDAPLSDLVDFTLGEDARAVGRLVQPVAARVTVYPADSHQPETRTVTITPGTWLVPADSMCAPY